MSTQGTRNEVATVVGRGPATPYVLVESARERQYMMTRKVYAGDWDALKRGDVVELITDGGTEVARILSARLLSSAAE